MKFNKEVLFKYYEKFYREILKGNFTQQIKKDLGFVITCIEEDSIWTDPRHVSNFLAQCGFESMWKYAPVKEVRAKPDTKLYDIQNKYWNTNYFGRSMIQITHKANYQKMSKYVGLDLVKNPDLALNPKVSYLIASRGMINGEFTGKKLSDYLNKSKTDWLNCRRIINGMDRAKDIEYYSKCIDTIIQASLIKEEAVPEYIPISEYEIPNQTEPVEIPQIPFEIGENTEQQEPISTTVTTKTESSTPNSTTTVEVEKNIPAPTQYIDAVIPRITSGLKAWKTALSGVLGSLGLGGAYSWLSEKFQFVSEHSGFIVGSVIIAAIFGLAFLAYRFWLINQREKRASELTLAQLKIRSDPSLTNVEVTTTNVRN